MADTLKFGPEWLRALSDGNNLGTPPPSPGFGKYKLADYRYGREEMLALFNPDADPPEDLKDIPSIFIEKKQEPLALVPLSDEEQRLLSQSVNSVAVLRMSGRGGPPGVRGGRGGAPTRGRGRGRGEFIQRGVSYEETGGGFGRPPTHNRNDGWEEVGAKRGFSRFDDGSTGPPKREFNRSLSSENWRERGGNEEEDEEGDWRKAGGSKWNARSSWRDPIGRGGFDRQNGVQRGGFDKGRAYQRNRTSESWDDEGENIPEWSMPDSEDVEELGTFDSSGAFVSTKLREEMKGEFKDNHQKSNSPPAVENKTKSKQKEDTPQNKTDPADSRDTDTRKKDSRQKTSSEIDSVPQQKKSEPPPAHDAGDDGPPAKIDKQTMSNKQSDKPQQKKAGKSKKEVTSDSVASQKETKPATEKAAKRADDSQPRSKVSDSNSKSSANSTVLPGAKKLTKNLSETENEALDRLQDTAENIVLAAMTAEEEEKYSQPTNSSSALPPDSENLQKWFYRDPQGDTQGPFLPSEMAEWFSAGYFTMNLLIRRGCDEKFSQLGELIKRWGRVPFLPGPPQQPILNTPPNPEAVQQQEHLKALQAQILLQQQVMQQQLMMRQLQMQQIQQVMQQLQENEQFKSLPLVQQQQLVMQLLAKQQPGMMVPQSQPQKLSPRSPPTEAAASGDHTPTSNHPSFHRSLSQPSDSHTEEGSIWGGVHALGTGSQPTSVWDLPVDPKSVITASELEAQLEKVRKDNDDTDRVRKQQEEDERRIMHEEFVRKQEELMKQTAEIQRQKEEMERQKQELERKRMLELQKIEEARLEEEARRRAEEEEKRKQEELQRQREEEMRRKQEEEMRLRREEEMRQQQELKRQEELRKYELRQEELRQQELQREIMLQKKREQEEIEKKKEIQRRQELQNQQEMQRQQQEALRKLQQDQLAKIQLPSHAQWGSQPVSSAPQKMKSLLEIQEQEEKERREKEEIQRQIEAERQQMLALQQQQQQQKSWSSQMFPSSTSSGMKTLLEIQEEQSRQQEKDKQRRNQQHQTQSKNLTLGAASAWGGTVSSPSHWASEGAWGNAVRQAEGMNSSASNGTGSLGFWDTAIISSKKAPPKQSNQGPPSDFPTLKVQTQKAPSTIQQPNKAKSSKSKKEEDAVQRLFQSSIPVDEFTQWCEKVLNNLNSSVDIPTFVSFLKEIESPYEVHDYVRTYLGETKSAQDFAKQFLEKRSYFRNKAKQQQQQVEDSIWGPAPARDFRQSNNQSSESDSQRSKGKKKKKMMKIDSSILGFTCAADPDRINVGEIDNDAAPK